MTPSPDPVTPSRQHTIVPSRRHPITTSSHHSITTSFHHPIARLARHSALLIAAAVLAAPGCNAAIGGLSARASDQWSRSYPLAEKGQVQIGAGNGEIEIEGVDGSMVEVRAERVARAATDAAARELLPRINIQEDVTPDRVALETERLAGITIGVSVQVNYHVRVPRSALVRARATNGEIAIVGIAGRVFASTTNGGINGRELSGGVDARATNGRVAIELRTIGDDPIDVRTTNGNVQLTVPQNAKANVSASCVNGTIDMSAVAIEPMGEQSKRRVRGRMNGGGTPVEVATVNGRVMISTR